MKPELTIETLRTEAAAFAKAESAHQEPGLYGVTASRPGMNSKTIRKVEFGDFQTPHELARRACKLLRRLGLSPGSVVEPTCGEGSFLRASEEVFSGCTSFLGFEINPDYVDAARALQRSKIHCEDFFSKNWPSTLNGLEETVLVVGNPPWVTNSTVGSLGGANLPKKSNFQRFNGLDAITGKSNFDISEWMMMHLLECLSGRRAVLAMLCKTVVARKVLRHMWSRNFQVSSSAVYEIDAAAYFGAAVDACFLICILEPGAGSRECAVYPDLDSSARTSTFALLDGRLVADSGAAARYGHLYGESPLKWRSGVKHDCASVMELHHRGGDEFENGLGESTRLEGTYLYPSLKSSELMKPGSVPSRCMIVTQRWAGENTSRIRLEAPRTWDYLQSHAARLDRRASSIYRNRPRFSIFGIGPYTFAPWKVAISGFYKRIDFQCVGPSEGRPVVFDDTCYFLPCENEEDARLLAALLNSKSAKGFFHSHIFWDAKRPITAQILGHLDLRILAEEAGAPLPTWSDAPQGVLPL